MEGGGENEDQRNVHQGAEDKPKRRGANGAGTIIRKCYRLGRKDKAMDKSDLLYDIASAQSKEQDECRRHFDTMSTGILALSGALVGMLVFSKADWAYWSVFPAVISVQEKSKTKQ